MRLFPLRPTAALCLASLILASCGAHSGRAADPIPPAAPLACDPRMTADVKPEPPVQGSIVQPVTAEQRAATGEFLDGEARAREWGREGWERAAVGKGWCARQAAAAQ